MPTPRPSRLVVALAAGLAVSGGGLLGQTPPPGPPPAESKSAALPAAAPALPTPAPAPVLPVMLPPLPPEPRARPSRRWEALARRNPGLVLFKNRWDPGALELKEDTVRWTDAKEPDKNLLIPMRLVLGHQLVCLRDPKRGCFEWAFRTRGTLYRFRDATREPGEAAKPAEIWELMRSAYPDLEATRLIVDSR